MSEICKSDKFSFDAEWYEIESSLVRKFKLFYFPYDDTIEMYDVKNRRIFLKRTICNGVTLKNLFAGSMVKIFARQIRIVGYADGNTHKKIGYSMQKTFGIIKPDAISQKGSIFKIINDCGFTISQLIMVKMDQNVATALYKRKEGESAFPFIVNLMISGPVVAMELVAENGICKWLEIIGPTDSAKAKVEVPKSIRACYGRDSLYNAVHGSDCEEAAETEKNIFFPLEKSKSILPKPTPILSGSTCCIIKPHAIKEGKIGGIVSMIEENKFQITCMEMFYLEHASAEEFYEVYKGVVTEYAAMVNELISGPCIAMEIVGPMKEATPVEFRKLIGPADPDIGRQLRPHTIRAHFGKNKVENAVHVTDLPEDAILEVEYFFKLCR